MNLNRRVAFLVTMLLIVSLASASAITDLKTFPRDIPINLQFPCRTADGGICDTNFNCFLTMQYPNTTLAFNKFNLTRVSSSSSYYNVTLAPTIPIGDYNNVEVFCTNNVLNGTESYQFSIRGNGSTPNITEGIVYLIVILVCSLVLGLSIWGAMSIRGGNTIDNDGNVLHVNNLKYVKMFLIGIIYTMLLILAFFGMNISYAVLSFDLAFKVFQWMFEILMYSATPFAAIMFVYFVIKIMKDIKINKILSFGGEYHA